MSYIESLFQNSWRAVATAAFLAPVVLGLGASSGIIGTDPPTIINDEEWDTIAYQRSGSTTTLVDEEERWCLHENTLNQKASPGDIIFLGDSLTDYARAAFDPIFPRSHNLAIAGLNIDGLTDTLDVLQMPIELAEASKLIICIGGNDVNAYLEDFEQQSIPDESVPKTLSSTIKSDYDSLFAFLNDWESNWTSPVPFPEVVFRAIPAVHRTNYRSSSHAIIRLANDYVKNNIPSSWRFIDDYYLFADGDGLSIDKYTLADNAHFNALGYRIWFESLAAEIFPLANFDSPMTLSSIHGPSSKPYSSLFQYSGVAYRYVTTTIPPKKTLTAQIDNVSGSKYVGIFDPGATLPYPPVTNPAALDYYSLPIAESGSSAWSTSCNVTNLTDYDRNVIVYVGALSGGISSAQCSLELSDIVVSDIVPIGADPNTLDFNPGIASGDHSKSGVNGTNSTLVAWNKTPNTSGLVSIAGSITHDGVNWSSPFTIYSQPSSAVKSRWDPDPLISGTAWAPRVAWNGEGWTVMFSTVHGIKVANGNVGATSWAVNSQPTSTSLSFPYNSLMVGNRSYSSWAVHEYCPNLIYRKHDRALLANWSTWGITGSPFSSSYMDVGVGYKYPSDTYWSIGNMRSLLTTPPHVGSVQYIMTDVCSEPNTRVSTYAPPVAPPGTERSISAWVEVLGNSSTLYVGGKMVAAGDAHFEAVIDNENCSIISPHVTWYPGHRSSDGNWVLTWSMKRNPGYSSWFASFGNDYDIFYSIGDREGKNWSAPLPLNADATYDSKDDILHHAASQPGLGYRAVWIEEWPSAVPNTMKVSDLVIHQNHNTAEAYWQTAEVNNYGLSVDKPRLAPGSGKWLHIVEANEADLYLVK